MSIYQAAEDSYLMSRILKEKIPDLLDKNPNLTFLEIGAGSGIHLQTALSLGIRKENIFSCDIDKTAVSHCNLLGFNCVYSDLFENVKGKYDIIIFNPPYLPLDKREPKDSKLATTGGKNGDEIIKRFLEQAKNYLSKNGIIFLITSSLSRQIHFNELGYNYNQVGGEVLFFEKLYIWELTEKRNKKDKTLH